MDEIIIRLSRSDDGIQYYIYDGHEAYMECDSLDGGVCESSMLNALDMAFSDTKDLLRRAS